MLWQSILVILRSLSEPLFSSYLLEVLSSKPPWQLLIDGISFLAVFRETGGARCAHNLVPCMASRSKALSIVEALILKPRESSADDDDMGTLLGLLSTVHPKNLSLKTDILKSLLKVQISSITL